MDLHRHRCGFDGWRDDEQTNPNGCGLVSEHDPDAGRVTHICTNCGEKTTMRYCGPLEPGQGIIERAPPKPSRPIQWPDPEPSQWELFP